RVAVLKGRDNLWEIRAPSLAQRRHRLGGPWRPTTKSYPHMVGIEVLPGLDDLAITKLVDAAVPVVEHGAVIELGIGLHLLEDSVAFGHHRSESQSQGRGKGGDQGGWQ